MIINGCECEPYLTVDHRLMLEMPADVLAGAGAIARAVGAERIILGIENNKPDAIEALTAEVSKEGLSGVEIVSLKTKYPQGDEKMLIKAILGREVPSGGLPMDVGVVVHNVGTTIAIAEALELGKPLIERMVTITGSGVREPKKLLVRIGTSFAEVIEQCGGLTEDAAKIILGNSWPIEYLEGKNVVVVGGGFAFTTLRSLIHYMLYDDNRKRFGDISVIYGARTPGLLCYKEELAAWEKRKDLRMHVTVDKGMKPGRDERDLSRRCAARSPSVPKMP